MVTHGRTTNPNHVVAITISGAAGSGKSTIRYLIEHLLRREGCEVNVVESEETREHDDKQRRATLQCLLVDDVFATDQRTMPRIMIAEKQTSTR